MATAAEMAACCGDNAARFFRAEPLACGHIRDRAVRCLSQRQSLRLMHRAPKRTHAVLQRFSRGTGVYRYAAPDQRTMPGSLCRRVRSGKGTAGSYISLRRRRLAPLPHHRRRSAARGTGFAGCQSGRCVLVSSVGTFAALSNRRNRALLAGAPSPQYTGHEVIRMEPKDVIFQLRTARGLSQDELAENCL